MNIYLYIALFLFCVYSIIRNIKMVKDNKTSKGFTSAYQALIKENEDGYNIVCDAYAKETSPIYKTGIAIIKAIYEISDDKEYQESLDNINLKDVFYSKEKLDTNLFAKNADYFLWLTLLLAAAKNKGLEQVKDEIINKFAMLDEAKETLEYHYIEAAAARIFDQEETFLNDLIEGNYANMPHSKNYIGFLKQTAEAILDSKGIVLDQFYIDDLKNFVGYAYGKYLMKSLGNYPKYEVKEEPIEENKEETSEENKEIENKEEDK